MSPDGKAAIPIWRNKLNRTCAEVDKKVSNEDIPQLLEQKLEKLAIKGKEKQKHLPPFKEPAQVSQKKLSPKLSIATIADPQKTVPPSRKATEALII